MPEPCDTKKAKLSLLSATMKYKVPDFAELAPTESCNKLNLKFRDAAAMTGQLPALNITTCLVSSSWPDQLSCPSPAFSSLTAYFKTSLLS
jgi:hypothetical protein